jgi:hypothetical protein
LTFPGTPSCKVSFNCLLLDMGADGAPGMR